MRKSALLLLRLRRAINVTKILDFYLHWSKRSIVLVLLRKAGVFAIVVRETLHTAWGVRRLEVRTILRLVAAAASVRSAQYP
jgi:hypothetical protein